jgi:CheY-like chemotaxis protein
MVEPGTCTILVADDDPDSREVMAELVKLMLPGATTLMACNGLDAVSVAMDVCPWAVILDLHMPVLSGVGAAQRLHARMGKEVPILIAASADHACLRGAYDIFDYSLRKPIDVHRMARYLARAFVFPEERRLRA